MTPDEAEKASRERHPAGSKFVPKVAILERISATVDAQYWMYGNAAGDVHIERWDLKSIIDYAVLSHGNKTQFGIDYGNFYRQRSEIMGLLLDTLKTQPGQPERVNWGDWRMWETDVNTTTTMIQKVIQQTLKAERDKENK